MKITFICKEDFGPLNRSPALFSLSQVRCFWHCLWFRMNCSSVPEDVCSWWPLMHWHQTQSTPSEAKFLKLLFLAILSQLWSFRLLVDLLIPHFPLLVNFLLTFYWSMHRHSILQPGFVTFVNWTTVKSAGFPWLWLNVIECTVLLLFKFTQTK